jgi:hypothetical protein
MNSIIRTEKATLNFSISIFYLPTPDYYYYPTSAKEWKRISVKFRPGENSNQERGTRLTPPRAMVPLTSEL